MKPIVVVGSLNMDLVSTASRIPAAGETITGKTFRTFSGGKGANQAVAVAKLGYPSVLLGAVGSDMFGTELKNTIGSYGVVTSHIATVDGSSGTAMIVVDDKGENSIIVTPGANDSVDSAYVEGKVDVLRSASMVLVQLELPMPTIEWLALCCAELGVPFMLDPAPATKLSMDLLSRVTWFTPNETESAYYQSEFPNAKTLEEELLKAGVQNVIAKRSNKGSVIYNALMQPLETPAYSVTAVDSTAAGDAYNGAFATSLVRGKSVADAARFASAAAAVSVTKPGAQSSLATQAEVEQFLASS